MCMSSIRRRTRRPTPSSSPTRICCSARDFKRSGVDLILSNADRELVVHDYFKGEQRHRWRRPMAPISPATSSTRSPARSSMRRPTAHCRCRPCHRPRHQAHRQRDRDPQRRLDHPEPGRQRRKRRRGRRPAPIRRSASPSSTAPCSACRRTRRMVLNEMVYDPNGSNNSSLISLVAGTISFVAGETAKHGDMKVDTPVATMGIRGTAVLVEIDFNVPGQNGAARCEIPGSGRAGRHHRLLHPVRQDHARSDRDRQQGRAAGQHQPERRQLHHTSPLSPELQKLITDVFTQKFTNTEHQHQDRVEHLTDSIVPLPFQAIKWPNGHHRHAGRSCDRTRWQFVAVREQSGPTAFRIRISTGRRPSSTSNGAFR